VQEIIEAAIKEATDELIGYRAKGSEEEAA
jgi:hypothetical protein